MRENFSPKFLEIVDNLNKALDTIEETPSIANDAMEDATSEENWRFGDIRDFCISLRKSIREHAVEHGYYYW